MTNQAEPERDRIQFDMTPAAVARLDAMRAATNAATRAEVIRRALAAYEWLLDVTQDENDIILVQSQDGQERSHVKARRLLKSLQ